MNNIVSLAIHDLHKRDKLYDIKLTEAVLKPSRTTQRVIDELYELYNRRSSKSHGKFTTSESSPTQGQIRDYVNNGTDYFLELTRRMMETLREQAQARAASTGGHVLFAHFQREDRDYLLVAIITDKLGAVLTGGAALEDVEHLDIDGFRFAGRINISGWSRGEEKYISFLKGKGDVAEYFRHFLGCDNVVQERVDTSNLVAALKTFVSEAKMSEKDGVDFLRRAKDICDRASQTREEIHFNALANELIPRDPDRLTAFLGETDRGLSDGFIPDRRALASLVRFKGGTKQWKVEFDRDAVNSGDVRYDRENNSIILANVPEDMVRQLHDEGLTRA